LNQDCKGFNLNQKTEKEKEEKRENRKRASGMNPDPEQKPAAAQQRPSRIGTQLPLSPR
jgi:hypothetical protein